jgi:hypothetical protein
VGATLGASDSKSGDRNPPKQESKVPRHRFTLVILWLNLDSESAVHSPEHDATLASGRAEPSRSVD